MYIPTYKGLKKVPEASSEIMKLSIFETIIWIDQNSVKYVQGEGQLSSEALKCYHPTNCAGYKLLLNYKFYNRIQRNKQGKDKNWKMNV
jgi:hypothetical protein